MIYLGFKAFVLDFNVVFFLGRFFIYFIAIIIIDFHVVFGFRWFRRLMIGMRIYRCLVIGCRTLGIFLERIGFLWVEFMKNCFFGIVLRFFIGFKGLYLDLFNYNLRYYYIPFKVFIIGLLGYFIKLDMHCLINPEIYLNVTGRMHGLR